MKIIALCGFFGSGKTTLLLRLVRYLTAERHQRVSIIQNEIGQVGVDDAWLRSDDLVVDSLLGGCICCQLSAELVSRLHQFTAAGETDVCLLEASGMATPTVLQRLLAGAGIDRASLFQIAVLDAARIERLHSLLALPVLEDAVASGDLCLLNKADAVSVDTIDRIWAEALSIRPEVPLHQGALRNAASLPEAIAVAVDRFLRSGTPGTPEGLPEPHLTGHETHAHAHGTPATWGGRVPVNPERSWGRAELESALAGFTEDLRSRGAIAVGHIKGLLHTTDSRGPVFFSLTELHATDASLSASGPFALSAITLNAIIYGLDPGALDAAIRDFFDKMGSP